MKLTNSVLFASWVLFTLFSCSGKNTSSSNLSSSNSIETDSIVEQPKPTINNDSVKLIIGDTYDAHPEWSEGSMRATHVYFQVGDEPKVELPFICIGMVSDKVFPFYKEEFSKATKNADIGQMVFSFYYEFADAGEVYFGCRKGDKLRIYSYPIDQSDDSESSVTWQVTYDISAKPAIVRIKDSHYYTPELKQKFFQPITYTEAQINDFIKTYLANFYDENQPEKSYSRTVRFQDYKNDELNLMYGESDYSQEDFYTQWNKAYDIDQWGYETTNNDDLCGGDIAYENLSYEITEAKKTTYFYTATVTVHYNSYGSSKKEDCQVAVRIVQIDGLLYFDRIRQNYEYYKSKELENKETLGDYPSTNQ